jgi:hypothetical protein
MDKDANIRLTNILFRRASRARYSGLLKERKKDCVRGYRPADGKTDFARFLAHLLGVAVEVEEKEENSMKMSR